jgi:hypothetical protein
VNRLEEKDSECESPTVLDKALALDYYHEHYILYVYRPSMFASEVVMWLKNVLCSAIASLTEWKDSWRCVCFSCCMKKLDMVMGS